MGVRMNPTNPAPGADLQYSFSLAPSDAGDGLILTAALSPFVRVQLFLPSNTWAHIASQADRAMKDLRSKIVSPRASAGIGGSSNGG